MNNNDKVLILSDNKASVRIANDAFNQVCSNEVITTDSILKAKEELMENSIIFFAINLKAIDKELLKFIKDFRRNNLNSSFKIPILSLVETPDQAKKAIDAGSTKYLQYPFGIGDFKQVLFEIVDAPKKFIMSENYVGPDRRDKMLSVRKDRRLQRNSNN